MWDRIANDVAIRWMLQCWVGMFISYLSAHLTVRILNREKSLTKYIDWILYYQTTVLLTRVVIIILQR